MLMAYGVTKRLKAAVAAFGALCLSACATSQPAVMPPPEPYKPVETAPPTPPKEVVWRDVAYGDNKLQKLDVYAQENLKGAPIIFMVHGGAWKYGDKGMDRVVDNKAGHYLSKGYVFVSINYRMLPEAYPLDQARDIATALAFVQANAASWGGDADRVVLMGHSAGAHLVALVNVNPNFAKDAGARPWLGAVGLDSGAYDILRLMKIDHAPLFDEAFGKKPDYWKSISPAANIVGTPPPMMLVCSGKRTESCVQSTLLKRALEEAGTKARVYPVDMAHVELNDRLGEDSDYTRAVDAFLHSLDLP